MKKQLANIGVLIGVALLAKALQEAGARALSGGGVSSVPRILIMMALGLLIGLPSAVMRVYYKAKPKDDYNELETLSKAYQAPPSDPSQHDPQTK